MKNLILNESEEMIDFHEETDLESVKAEIEKFIEANGDELSTPVIVVTDEAEYKADGHKLKDWLDYAIKHSEKHGTTVTFSFKDDELLVIESGNVLEDNLHDFSLLGMEDANEIETTPEEEKEEPEVEEKPIEDNELFKELAKEDELTEEANELVPVENNEIVEAGEFVVEHCLNGKCNRLHVGDKETAIEFAKYLVSGLLVDKEGMEGGKSKVLLIGEQGKEEVVWDSDKDIETIDVTSKEESLKEGYIQIADDSVPIKVVKKHIYNNESSFKYNGISYKIRNIYDNSENVISVDYDNNDCDSYGTYTYDGKAYTVESVNEEDLSVPEEEIAKADENGELPAVELEEPLKAEAPVEEEIPEDVEKGALSSLINNLTAQEWGMIDGYNSAIATMKAEGVGEDAITILNKIVEERTISIGMLQKALEIVDPEQAELIVKGMDKAEGEEKPEEPEEEPENEKEEVSESLNEDLLLVGEVFPEQETNIEGVKGAEEVMSAYQKANKHLDTIKECIYTKMNCPFFSSYVHELAHTMPERFDKFGDILHTVNMEIPYPSTEELVNKPENITDAFTHIFCLLDEIKCALNSFIKENDEENHGLSCSAEALLNDIENEYPALFRLQAKAVECGEDTTSFDKFVGQFVEHKDDLLN